MRYDRCVSEHLPFLVVHGALVWKAIAVASACLGPAALVARARRKHRATVRREISQLRAGESPLAVGKVALTGTLHGGSATSIEQAHAIVDRRDDAMWLDVGGERVELVGPLRVEAGASVRTAWWWPGRLGKDVAARWLAPTTARTIRDGDQAFVLGVLEEGASGDAGYRESSRTWRLRANEAGAIAMSATASNERPMPRSPLRHAFIGLSCGAVTVFALAVVGAIAMSSVGRHDLVYGQGGPRRASIESYGALTLAAATPHSRSDALAELNWQISERLTFTSTRIELQAEIDEQFGNCSADTYEHAGWFDEALAAAERCGRADLAMQALIDLGRYDEAWGLHIVAGDHPSLELAIATGNWAEAAAASAAGLPPVSDACTYALFRTYAGDRDAFEKVGRPCPLELALASAPTTWASKLGWQRGATSLPLDRVELALGVTPLDQALVANDIVERYVAMPWLARAVAPGSHAMRVLADVELGDFTAARGELARADLPDDVRLAISNAIALREGTPVGDVTRGEPVAVLLRRGAPLPYPPPASCDKQLAAGFQGSDAGALVHALELCPTDDWPVDAFAIAVLPRFGSHRSELAALLHAQPPWRLLDRTVPAILDAAALRRDAARLAGDTAESARWQTIVQRQAKVLDDPRKAVAFVLLHD